MTNVPHIYTASGWFCDNDQRILHEMENFVEELKNKNLCTIHRPRVDGVELKPGEFHDPSLRRKVFNDNVVNIDSADIIYANLTVASAPRLDTGTVWEVAYAISRGKIVVVLDEYNGDYIGDSLLDRFSGLLDQSNVRIFNNMSTANKFIENILVDEDFLITRMAEKEKENESSRDTRDLKDYPLVFLPESTELLEYEGVVKSLQEIYGKNVAYATNLRNLDNARNISRIMEQYPYLVMPISKRDPIVIYMMGVAYYKKIPVITYSDSDASVNLMLVCSVKYHASGSKQLVEVLNKVHQGSIDDLDFDDSELRVY